MSDTCYKKRDDTAKSGGKEEAKSTPKEAWFKDVRSEPRKFQSFQAMEKAAWSGPTSFS